MYGLDKATDLTFLIGKSLTQICIGLFQLILNMDNGLSISVEGAFEYIVPGRAIQSGELPGSACFLVELLGKKIIGVDIASGGTLVLMFENGSHLRFLDSNPDAESYQITGLDKDIVV